MYSPGAEEGAWFTDSCGGPGAQEQCDSWGQGAVAGEGRPECALTLLVPLLLGAWLHLTSERQHLKRGIKSKGRSLLHSLWNLEEAFCSRCFPGGVVVKKEKKKAACQCRKTQEMRVGSLGRQDPLQEEMATHPSILARRIPWTEEPGRLQSMQLHGVGLD